MTLVEKKFQTIGYHEEAGIGFLEVNRPEALNALNRMVIQETHELLHLLERSETLRCLIITGAGEKAFVAGADIKEIAELSREDAKHFASLGQRLFRHFEVMRVPVIAAVNGFALGGGLELAMACDFIIASDNARFGLPEVSLGVMPGFGGTQRLARYVGLQKAREMVFTGNHYKAEEALQMGLVNKVVPLAELKNTVMSFAKTISSRGPVAVAKAKEAMNKGYDCVLDEAMLVERDLFAELFITQDQKIGTSAFINKQTPKFVGK